MCFSIRITTYFFQYSTVSRWIGISPFTPCIHKIKLRFIFPYSIPFFAVQDALRQHLLRAMFQAMLVLVKPVRYKTGCLWITNWIKMEHQIYTLLLIQNMVPSRPAGNPLHESRELGLWLKWNKFSIFEMSLLVLYIFSFSKKPFYRSF